jgi:hypothetical protein
MVDVRINPRIPHCKLTFQGGLQIEVDRCGSPAIYQSTVILCKTLVYAVHSPVFGGVLRPETGLESRKAVSRQPVRARHAQPVNFFESLTTAPFTSTLPFEGKPLRERWAQWESAAPVQRHGGLGAAPHAASARSLHALLPSPPLRQAVSCSNGTLGSSVSGRAAINRRVLIQPCGAGFSFNYRLVTIVRDFIGRVATP